VSVATGGIVAADLGRDRFGEALGVLTRGMRDNPVHVAAFGPDPERRRRALERLFGALFRIKVDQTPICAMRDETIVAATGVAPAGTCQPSGREAAAFLPVVAGLGPRTAARTSRWISAWSRRDPPEPHVHLGPLAVDAGLQGQGIGSILLAEHCRRLDAAGEVGYLETDKEQNVAFYARQGFETVDEAQVLGVPNWFMRRPPSRSAM